MGKSVYSLILNDEVIKKIDTLAYARRTSRSNYISEVLASHVSYTTTQQRIKDILDAARAFLEPYEKYAFVEMNSNSFMDVRTALSYRYRPTIRYCLEILGRDKGPFLKLKAQVRTQSSSLISAIEDFFTIWQKVEKQLIPDAYDEVEMTSYENVCYTRFFFLNDRMNIEEQRLGKAIAAYITTLDKALDIFMSNMDNTDYVISDIYATYKEYYAKTGMII